MLERPKRRRPLPPPRQRFIVNLPPDVANKIRKLAERERRSLTTQIQVLIEHALADQSTDVVAA